MTCRPERRPPLDKRIRGKRMRSVSPPDRPSTPPQGTSSGLAIASLVCGSIAPFFSSYIFFNSPAPYGHLFLALVAILTGHIARSRVKRSGGVTGGGRIALAGLILGYGSIVFVPFIPAIKSLFTPTIVPHRVKADLTQCLTNVREIWKGLNEYQTNQATDTAPYPSDIRQLDSLGFTTNIEELLSLRAEYAGDWLYFSAADSENPSALLLVSPDIGHKHSPSKAGHVALTVDGTAAIWSWELVEKRMKESPVPPDRIPASIKEK